MLTLGSPRCHGDVVSHFGEGVLRPPVPGGEYVKSDAVRPESYEPEGRASPDHAHPGWAESLSALLDDQDGIALFRDFLAKEGCTDVIDFWLACSGFQLAYCAPASCLSTSADIMDKRRLKLAKAIYRKYIIISGIVAKKIKPMTKSWIRERVRHRQLDSTLFEQARQEVQEVMEVETYPIFLKSDVFLTYAQEICTEQENHKQELNSQRQETGNEKKDLINSEPEPNSKQEVNGLASETGNGKNQLKQKTDSGEQEVPQFLPKVVKKREWVGSEIASANHKRPDHWEAGYKLKHRMIQGCVRADAHNTSVLHQLSKHSMPKDIHTEPHKFAADLISRLELVQKERVNFRRVEEHLHPVCTQHVDDDAQVSTASSLCPTHFTSTHHGSSHCTVQLYDTHAENPEIVLDEHSQSVIRTPSWSSSTTHTHSHACPNNSDTWCYGDMAGTNQSEALGYSSRRRCVCETMTVAYYFCGEPIPYRTTVRGGVVTLAHFRELLTKKGAYRFFFKKASDEFDCGVVYEEVREEDAVLPVFEGRIIGKVEKIY